MDIGSGVFLETIIKSSHVLLRTCMSHNSAIIFDHLHIFIGFHSLLGFNSWFSHWSTARILVKLPWYLCDLIHLPFSAISLRPLRSLDRHDLFLPWAKTSMAQTRAFAIIGPALWNQLSPSIHVWSTLLIGEPSASFRFLKTALFFVVSCTGSTYDWCAPQEAL